MAPHTAYNTLTSAWSRLYPLPAACSTHQQNADYSNCSDATVDFVWYVACHVSFDSLLAQKTKESNPSPNEMPADAGRSLSRVAEGGRVGVVERTAGPRSHSLCLTSIRRIEVSLFTHATSAAVAWGPYRGYGSSYEE